MVLLNQFESIENEDYLLRNVEEQSKSSRGVKHKKEYLIKYNVKYLPKKNDYIYVLK
jgi:hypothetical protein